MSSINRPIAKELRSGPSLDHDALLPIVYSELRCLAAAQMNREAPGNTLQPTALVHEAWLNLVRSGTVRYQDEGHFMAKAAEVMRCILIDRARKKATVRHGGGMHRIDFDQVSVAVDTAPDALLQINDALEKLARESEPKAELVKLRFFAGLSREEAAAALGVSLATADRWWAFARAWLMVELQRQ